MVDATILVVEDDKKISSLLCNVMEDEGYRAIEVGTAADALNVIGTQDVDLITLDIHLGSDNGLELARAIRKQSHVPIIMITGKDDVIDRVVGLEIGADDYITKPFHIREVIARVGSVLRRTKVSVPDIVVRAGADISVPLGSERCYVFDGLTAEMDRMEVTDRKGVDCGLTSGDFKLLTVFLERPKRVLSRDQLMDFTGGQEWNPLDRTIDNQIARLRKKIERDPSNPKLIKTVRGVGYTLACDVQPCMESAKSA